MLETSDAFTRPDRSGKVKEEGSNTIETDEQMHIFERQGKVVELRTYNTVHGARKYATIEDGQVNLSNPTI